MKSIFVLAGNQTEYLQWARKFRDELVAKNFFPRYLPTGTLNYLGHKDCFFTEVGSFYRTDRHNEIYNYFETHNIIKI